MRLVAQLLYSIYFTYVTNTVCVHCWQFSGSASSGSGAFAATNSAAATDTGAVDEWD